MFYLIKGQGIYGREAAYWLIRSEYLEEEIKQEIFIISVGWKCVTNNENIILSI